MRSFALILAVVLCATATAQVRVDVGAVPHSCSHSHSSAYPLGCKSRGESGLGEFGIEKDLHNKQRG
jgi:hypothetical protein